VNVATLLAKYYLYGSGSASKVVKDFVACNEVRKEFFSKGAKCAGSVGHPMTKMLSASGGGLRPLTP